MYNPPCCTAVAAVELLAGTSRQESLRRSPAAGIPAAIAAKISESLVENCVCNGHEGYRWRVGPDDVRVKLKYPAFEGLTVSSIFTGEWFRNRNPKDRGSAIGSPSSQACIR